MSGPGQRLMDRGMELGSRAVRLLLANPSTASGLITLVGRTQETMQALGRNRDVVLNWMSLPSLSELREVRRRVASLAKKLDRLERQVGEEPGRESDQR